MAFWNTAGEPLRQYRWYMVFGGTAGSLGVQVGGTGTGLDPHRYALKKVDKPKSKINEITHKYLNHFYYYPGRLEWEAINMTIVAATNPSVDDALYNILLGAGYQYPGSYGDDRTISKKKFIEQLGNSISIVQINSNGDPVEEWILKNPFFTSVQFGTLDYSSEEVVDIQCTIRYDSAEYNNVNAVPNAEADI